MEFIGSGVLELACASLQEITVKFSGIFQAGHKKLHMSGIMTIDLLGKELAY